MQKMRTVVVQTNLEAQMADRKNFTTETEQAIALATRTVRKLAVILDRESLKWFRPSIGQFQIFYKSGVVQSDYVPDFVAETETYIYMMEPKARNDMESAEVQAKKDAAVNWCAHATKHSTDNGGKPWKYVLIPHDAIMENMSVAGLVSRFGA